MLETDYLYSNDMIAQCEAAITNLEKENDKLNILKNEILAFVEDEELISRRVSNAKLHFYDYYLICKILFKWFQKNRKKLQSSFFVCGGAGTEPFK